MNERDKLIWNLAVAIRRLLIGADKKSSAARFAAKMADEADKVVGLTDGN